jgi:hypothetical protein
MSKQDQIQDFTETEPLNDSTLTAEQADQVRAGIDLGNQLWGEGKRVTIDICK